MENDKLAAVQQCDGMVSSDQYELVDKLKIRRTNHRLLIDSSDAKIESNTKVIWQCKRVFDSAFRSITSGNRRVGSDGRVTKSSCCRAVRLEVLLWCWLIWVDAVAVWDDVVWLSFALLVVLCWQWYLWRTKDQIVVYPGHCKIYANNQVATELKSKAQSFCGIHNTKWLHPMIKKKGEKFVLLWMGHSILLPLVIISID